MTLARKGIASSSDEDSELEPSSLLNDDLTFVRQARRQDFWRRPAVRKLMAVAAVLLALLLVLQVAIQDRDRLAAAEPALRPWLAMLCGALHCTIAAPRRIESIAIESSSFNQLRGDAYRLQVTLKNQAATEVALPSLELTLTDGQERAVVRRVLTPGELGANTGVIAPHVRVVQFAGPGRLRPVARRQDRRLPPAGFLSMNKTVFLWQQ